MNLSLEGFDCALSAVANSNNSFHRNPSKCKKAGSPPRPADRQRVFSALHNDTRCEGKNGKKVRKVRVRVKLTTCAWPPPYGRIVPEQRRATSRASKRSRSLHCSSRLTPQITFGGKSAARAASSRRHTTLPQASCRGSNSGRRPATDMEAHRDDQQMSK